MPDDDSPPNICVECNYSTTAFELEISPEGDRVCPNCIAEMIGHA